MGDMAANTLAQANNDYVKARNIVSETGGVYKDDLLDHFS